MSKDKSREHLRRFFSRSNAEFLYSSIIDAIIETHNFNIRPGEFKTLLKRSMEHVAETIPKDQMTLEALNRETSNRTAKDIVKHIQKEMSTQKHEELTRLKQKEEQLKRQQHMKPNTPQMGHRTNQRQSTPQHHNQLQQQSPQSTQQSPQQYQPQSTQQHHNLSQQQSQQQSQYHPHHQQQSQNWYEEEEGEYPYHEKNGVPIPHFEDALPDPGSLPDIDALYEHAEYERQTNDILPPPSSETKDMFKRNGQEVLNKPKLYEKFIPRETPPAPRETRRTISGEQPRETLHETLRETLRETPRETLRETLRERPRGDHEISQRGERGESYRETRRPRMSTKISELKKNTVAPPYEEPFVGDNSENDDHYFSSNELEIHQQREDDEIAAYVNVNDPKNDLRIEPVAEVARLIPKTSRNVLPDSQIIPHIYVVDSRDRDESIYPDPSNYRIRTPEFKEVVSISLEDAQIPITGYVINEYNNLLYFQEETDITQIAEIPVGNYDADELAMTIETVLNATSANGILYTVVNDPLTNKYVITSGAVGPFIFNLLFFGGLETFSSVNEPNKTSEAVYIENSIGPVIGFDKKNYTGSLEYISPFVYNLGGEKYIVMFIKEADRVEANKSSIHRAFAKIAIDVPRGAIKFFDNVDNRTVKYFSPINGTLSHLTIEFRTYDGNLYNFNGQEHSFTLKIVTKDITQTPY